MTQTAPAPFSTCDLCDPYRDAMPPGFAVLPPVFNKFGSGKPFYGQVATVKCYEDNTTIQTVLNSPGKGRVLVVAGGSSLRTALIGGNLGATAQKNGWAGLVVDGCVRDVHELVRLDIGVRALACSPMPPTKRQPGLVEVTVRVQGVYIMPGSWLYADDDGIVISDKKLV